MSPSGDAPARPSPPREAGGAEERFPPERRIRKGSEFAAVLERGRRHRYSHFTLHVLLPPSVSLSPGTDAGVVKQERDFARLGVIASRRVGGAVARNRAKRLLREAFRRCGSRLPQGADIVVVARGSIAKARPEDIERAFSDVSRETRKR